MSSSGSPRAPGGAAPEPWAAGGASETDAVVDTQPQASPTPQNPFDQLLTAAAGDPTAPAAATSSRDHGGPRNRTPLAVPDSPRHAGTIPTGSISSSSSSHNSTSGGALRVVPSSPVAALRPSPAAAATTTGSAAAPATTPHRDALPPPTQPPSPLVLSQAGTANSTTNSTPPVPTLSPYTPPLSEPGPSYAVPAASHPHHHTDDDDGNTEPSSQPSSYDHPTEAPQRTTTALSRLLSSKRRRHGTDDRKEEEDDDDEEEDRVWGNGAGALISGYLHKLGRNGKWQRRWFETDGECLSYYKSTQRTKLLATLDLEKVGRIGVNTHDPQGCSFRIEVLGRDYHLRADSRASCRDWVITLNRVKEARLQQGNVKLVAPNQPPVDLLDDTANRDRTPRVVVVSNRERTRAVDQVDPWDEMMDPAASDQELAAIGHLDTSKRRSAIETVVLARWSKRNSSISRLAAKLARWARSLSKYSCMNMDSDAVHLDRHVHPPGHDDKHRRKLSKEEDMGGMFPREDPIVNNPPATMDAAAGLAKPNRNIRAFSVASSEDESRMLA